MNILAITTGLALAASTCQADARACHIVYSGGTNGNYAEKRSHEIAHCNGWEHGVRGSFFGKAFTPPKRFAHEYPGTLYEYKVSLGEARRVCNGAFACQWFE